MVMAPVALAGCDVALGLGDLKDRPAEGSASPDDANGSDAKLTDAESGLDGNLWEWNIDGYGTPYVDSCDDCANFTVTSKRVVRGGSYFDSEAFLLTWLRNSVEPGYRNDRVGIRCARTP